MLPWYLGVVRLCSAEAKELVADDLPTGSLGLRCQIAVEVAGGGGY
jgi:hypothetical protein